MDDNSPLRAGALFAGDFRLIEPLGRGGMGSVWVVEQVSTGRRRALKLLDVVRRPGGDPALEARHRERFLQEARISARIESANVVEVVGAGIEPGTNTPWIAMELLAGEDLSRRIERCGPMNTADVLALFEQLCHAIAAAHDAGVLHLDLKPANIFVAEPRWPGVPFTVKVLDFGIGRLMRSEAQTHVTMTHSAGSPFWMAPEQALDGERAAPGTDIWALGLIAFRCFTGRRYWRTGNQPEKREASFGAWVLEMAAVHQFEQASVRAASLGAPGRFPAELDPWFARCVAQNLEDRYGDVRAMWRDLRSLLRGAPELDRESKDARDEGSAEVRAAPAGVRAAAAAVHEPMLPPDASRTDAAFSASPRVVAAESTQSAGDLTQDGAASAHDVASGPTRDSPADAPAPARAAGRRIPTGVAVALSTVFGAAIALAVLPRLRPEDHHTPVAPAPPAPGPPAASRPAELRSGTTAVPATDPPRALPAAPPALPTSVVQANDEPDAAAGAHASQTRAAPPVAHPVRRFAYGGSANRGLVAPDVLRTAVSAAGQALLGCHSHVDLDDVTTVDWSLDVAADGSVRAANPVLAHATYLDQRPAVLRCIRGVLMHLSLGPTLTGTGGTLAVWFHLR